MHEADERRHTIHHKSNLPTTDRRRDGISGRTQDRRPAESRFTSQEEGTLQKVNRKNAVTTNAECRMPNAECIRLAYSKTGGSLP
eukprot:scaffold51859_cov52-Attheya_sp.AAC.5